jgi:hypothetical protein
VACVKATFRGKKGPEIGQGERKAKAGTTNIERAKREMKLSPRSGMNEEMHAGYGARKIDESLLGIAYKKSHCTPQNRDSASYALQRAGPCPPSLHHFFSAVFLNTSVPDS